MDDLAWYHKLGDLAEIDKVTYNSLPLHRQPNPATQGAGNPLIVRAYTFAGKKLDRARKHPLLIYVHGGVHSNFGTGSAHIIRELVEQGYVVVAPDYRGSTGYGRAFYGAIDYGGRENDDVFAARNWAAEALPYVDLFSAPYHIDKTAEQDVNEYLRRSPVTHVDKLRTPLLIHTNTNDEDVNVLEVRRSVGGAAGGGQAVRA